MKKWFLVAFGFVALLIVLAPAPSSTAAPVMSPTFTSSPTHTPGGPTFTPTPTRMPTSTPQMPRPAPDWAYFAGGSLCCFGSSAEGAGDVNGDGYADAVFSGASRLYLFLGSAAGFGNAPAWSYETWYEYVSIPVAAGDVNGDGYDDVLVGMQGDSNGVEHRGRAYLFYGSPQGLKTRPDWSVSGETWHAFLGRAVSGAGDVNGDGYADVVIGASGTNGGAGNGQGRVYVYCGSASGLGATPCWKATGDQVGGYFGEGATGGAGDVNGDGYADLLIAAPSYSSGEADEGRAFLYFGSAQGLAVTPGWTAEGNQAGALFGTSGGPGAGDVNSDGYADLVLAAPAYDGAQADTGRVWVYLGSTAGPSQTADWTLDGDQPGSHFGGAAKSAGDLNSDGYGDLVIGARGYDHPEPDEGAAWVYYGAKTQPADEEGFFVEADLPYTDLASSVGRAGDVNGDGVDDLILGAPRYGALNKGAAFAYLGRPAAPAATNTPTATPTATAEPTATPTPTTSPTPTHTPTLVPTITPTWTLESTATATATALSERLYLPMISG